jgi:hypothetical protein
LVLDHERLILVILKNNCINFMPKGRQQVFPMARRQASKLFRRWRTDELPTFNMLNKLTTKSNVQQVPE